MCHRWLHVRWRRNAHSVGGTTLARARASNVADPALETLQYASALERLVMRRYAVRFLVAVLTFGIGVALSLAFGLFRVKDTNDGLREWTVSTCRKKGFVARPAFLTVDVRSTDPLTLVYLGREAGRMQLAVGNRSNQTVSHYLITSERIWETNRKSSVRGFDWTSTEVLEPGETTTITLPLNTEGLSLRVARVNFEDGSAWINPRMSQ